MFLGTLKIIMIKSILIEAKKQEKEMMNLTFESFFNRQHIDLLNRMFYFFSASDFELPFVFLLCFILNVLGEQ